MPKVKFTDFEKDCITHFLNTATERGECSRYVHPQTDIFIAFFDAVSTVRKAFADDSLDSLTPTERGAIVHVINQSTTLDLQRYQPHGYAPFSHIPAVEKFKQALL